jgi:hypothetical protein
MCKVSRVAVHSSTGSDGQVGNGACMSVLSMRGRSTTFRYSVSLATAIAVRLDRFPDDINVSAVSNIRGSTRAV